MKKLESQISIALFVILVVVSLLLFIPMMNESFDRLKFVVYTTVILDFIIILFFYKMDISILDKKYLIISFGIGIIKKKIILKDIKSYEETNLPLSYGLGIRSVGKDTWVYNSRSGKGIKLETKNGNTYLLSVNKIDAFKKNIQEYI